MGNIFNKHRIFADAYLASQLNTEKDRVAEAEAVAGYKPGGGARLLRLPDVREYIEQERRDMEKAAEGIMDIADSEEITALINSIVAEYKAVGGLEQPIGDFIASKQAKGEVFTNIMSDHGAADSQEESGCTIQERFERELKKVLEREMMSPENQRDEIAGPEKVAAFLTAVMNGGDPDRFSSADLRDQMKAAEFLAKYHGMFTREQTEREQIQPVVISGEDDIES